MWTSEEAEEIISIAKGVIPDLKILSLPEGLQVKKGPDGVVDYIEKHIAGVLK